MVEAEKRLLRAGHNWYTTWRATYPSTSGEQETVHEASDVAIGSDQTIHTVEFSTVQASDGLPLVCMHGFATGLGIYYAALPALASRWRGRVFALDSLGCGLSSRPKWCLGHGQDCLVEDAENFFIDGLERWRASMRIEKMVLMGHSLGGYLAVAYAERHPDRVERLVLVSAVGVPEPPSELAEAHRRAPLPFRILLGAWAGGWSPFSFAKLGLANVMLGRYVQFRFAERSWVLKPELQAYFVGSWTAGDTSAGGTAHSTLLVPGGLGELAYARTPMGPSRIPSLKVDLTAIYGEHDWMDWRHMAKVRSAIEQARAAAGHEGPRIEIFHVADANHNVQVDNPLGFVDAVMASGQGKRQMDGKLFGREYHATDRLADESI